MFLDKNHTSIHLTLAKHLWEFYTNAEKMKQPLQVAVILGAHPAWSLGALNIGSIDEEEFYLMGSLAGEPMEVVPAETLDLKVPARAEMILEGEILPFERVGRGSVRRVHRLFPGQPQAGSFSREGDYQPQRRFLARHCRGAPRSSAVVHDPYGSQSLPRREGHGSVRKGGADSGAVYSLRFHREKNRGAGEERHPGGARL